MAEHLLRHHHWSRSALATPAVHRMLHRWMREGHRGVQHMIPHDHGVTPQSPLQEDSR